MSLRFWRQSLAIYAVGIIGCSDGTGPDGNSLGTFNVGVVFDNKPNAPGSGELTFREISGGRMAVTGQIAMPAMPNGVFTRFEDGTLSDGVVRFRVAGQSWQFEGTFTSDGGTITGEHVLTSAGVASGGNWGGSKAVSPGPPPVPF